MNLPISISHKKLIWKQSCHQFCYWVHYAFEITIYSGIGYILYLKGTGTSLRYISDNSFSFKLCGYPLPTKHFWRLKYLNKINKEINNDLEVAHPQSGSSSTWFLVELEFGNAGFWGEGKTEVPGEKPRGAKERTNNKLNPHMPSTPGYFP